MRTIVRHAVIATSAIIGFSVFAAVAAPAEAGDPSATGKPASPGLTDSSHKMADKIEQRIKDLHARLLIAPMQETQWAQFSEVMRTNARNTDQMFQTRLRALPVMTAAENMASYAQIAAEHA